MPIMNGPTATKIILNNSKFSKIPIIGITGNVLKSDTDFFINQGAKEVIHKPLNIVKVKNLLIKWLNLSIDNIFKSSPVYKDNSKYDMELSTALINYTHQKDKDEAEESEWFMMALNV
mmetsp:Transcript_27437/g.32441  ORF Transcript_27437/g.32441 Transcript_27437/m.32441 type:complete len:118 (+) Transcript_27437:2-355(+)